MIVFHLTALVALALALAAFRSGRPPIWLRLAAGACVLGVGLLLACGMGADGVFGIAGNLFIAGAIYLPVFLAVAGCLVVRRLPWIGATLLTLAAALVATGAYARFVEPARLVVRQHTIQSPRLREPVRIAFITDVQTDAPGDHERRALRLAMDARPDVIVFGGDYVQQRDNRKADACRRLLNQMLKEAGVGARLGVFALRGNIGAHEAWDVIFDGTGVRTVEQTLTVTPRDDLRLALLSYPDSLRADLVVAPRHDAFTVVAGHSPDYALASPAGDLLLAGHTHGGQVRLPLIGPLLTLAHVPRAWASGVTRLDNGATLIVSNGVGLERRGAPRIRLLCPPDIWVIDGIPVASTQRAEAVP
ncbi:MAG: putative metallophosphoesterase [Lentisphaerae bacterium ADurb.BinA184]|nr:MAG: putative metallophosphoesterase [Lentisphaerae bacterium ADurb.BinA184]